MSRLRNCSLALLFVSALALLTVLSMPVESVSVDVAVRHETDASDSLVISPAAASMRFAQVANSVRGSDSDEDSEESSEESSESGRRKKKRSRKNKKSKAKKAESSVSKSSQSKSKSSGSSSKSESSRSRSESSRSRSEASSLFRSEGSRSKSEGSSRSESSSHQSSGSSSHKSSGSSSRSSSSGSGSSPRSSSSGSGSSSRSSSSGSGSSSRSSSSGSGSSSRSGSSRSESSHRSSSSGSGSTRSESSHRSSGSSSRSEASHGSSGSRSRSESSLIHRLFSSESSKPFSSSSSSHRSESSRSRSSEGSSRSESSHRSESSSRSRSRSESAVSRWENSAAGRRLSTKSRESVSSINSEQAEEASAESSLQSQLLNGSFAEQVAGTINGLAQVIDKVYSQVQQDEVVFKTFKNKMLEDEIAKAVPDYNWPAIEKLVKAEVQTGKTRIENQVANFKIDVLDTVQKGLDQLRSDVRDTTTTDPAAAHGENSEESSKESSESTKVGTYDKYPYGVKHPPSSRKKRHSESGEDGLSADVLKRLKFSENTDQGPAEFETNDLFGTLPSTPLDAISKSLDHLVAKGDKETIYHFILKTIAARRKSLAEKKKAESKYGETATKALEDLRRQLTGKIPAHEIGSEIFERLEDLTRDQLRHPSNDTAEALKQIQQTLIQALRKKEIDDLHNEDSEESTESTRRRTKATGLAAAENSESAMRARLRRLKEAASKKLDSNISSIKKLAKDTLAMQRRLRDKESSSSSNDLNAKHVPLPDAVTNLEKVWQESKRAVMASRGAASMAADMAREARDHADILRSTTASQLNSFAKSEQSRSESPKPESTTQNVEAEDVTRYRHNRVPEPSAPRPVAPPAQLPALESIVAEHEKLLQRLGRPLTWEEKQIKNKLDLIKKNFTVVPEVRNGLEHKVLPAVKERNPSRQQTWALRGVEVVDSIAPDAVIDSASSSSSSSSSESSSRLVNGRQPIILTAP